MRILQLIESLEFGGAEKVVVTLANAMARDHQVSVCCARRTGELAGELRPDVRLHCLGARDGNDVRLPFRIASLARRERSEVVHAHNWSLFIEAAIAARRAAVPVLVHTVHGPYLSHAPSRLGRAKRGLRHWLERRMAPRFRGIAAVSDSIARDVRDEIGLPGGLLLTIHNGIPDAEAAGNTRRTDRGGDAVTFLTIGRLAAVKNQPLLLRAFAEVRRTLPRARLLVVGDGPERPALDALTVALGLGDAVSLTGFRTDISSFLSEADVFVLSSRHEGISIAVLEAMQAGLPVVATRVGGVPETVVDGETGLLVASEDEAALAAAMVRLGRGRDLRREMGQRGRALQAREFSLRVMTERYLRLYGVGPPEEAVA